MNTFVYITVIKENRKPVLPINSLMLMKNKKVMRLA